MLNHSHKKIVSRSRKIEANETSTLSTRKKCICCQCWYFMLSHRLVAKCSKQCLKITLEIEKIGKKIKDQEKFEEKKSQNKIRKLLKNLGDFFCNFATLCNGTNISVAEYLPSSNF